MKIVSPPAKAAPAKAAPAKVPESKIPAAGDPSTETTETTESKKEDTRVNFIDVCPKTLLDGAGKLTRVPLLTKEFVQSEHKRLARTDFVTEDLFLEHQANLCENRAQALAARAIELRAEADRTRKCGDPEARKKMKRAAKLMEQLKLLKDQMAKDGINLDDL